MMPSHKDLRNILIREFRIEDYDALIVLWNRAKLPYKPGGRDRRDKIEQELKRGKAIFLVAETHSRLAGSVLATHDGRKGWINRLAVDPEFRRQGVARMLVTQAEDWLSQLGIQIVACLIEDWNVESMEVFEKLGYTRHPDVSYLTKREKNDV